MERYVFAGSAEDPERERLAGIEADSDPRTFRRLEALGLGPGRAFLEVGAGGGSVARWACERVRPGGRVVAIDEDTRFLRERSALGLEIRAGDIRTLDLDPAAFDIAHARLVLLHIPEYEAVFRKLIAALKPGGWVLIEDLDFSTQAPATGDPRTAELIRRVFDAMTAFHVSAGVCVDMGRRLPALFQRAGLQDVEVETALPLAPGGSTTARSLGLTLRRIAGRMAGVAEADTREFVALLDDPQCWMMHAARVAVWGRAPGGHSQRSASTG